MVLSFRLAGGSESGHLKGGMCVALAGWPPRGSQLRDNVARIGVRGFLFDLKIFFFRTSGGGLFWANLKGLKNKWIILKLYLGYTVYRCIFV